MLRHDSDGSHIWHRGRGPDDRLRATGPLSTPAPARRIGTPWRDPSPGLADGANDRLLAGVNMDVLDPDQLLALAAVLVERVGQRRK